MSAPPRLGNLPGMYWDAERARYFPLPKGAKAKDVPAHKDKDGAKPKCVPAKCGRSGQPAVLGTRRLARSLGLRDDGMRLRTQHRLASATLFGVAELCECPGESITSLQSFGTGGMCVTTDHGKVIVAKPDKRTAHSRSVCSQRLLGIHFNVARSTWLAVSNGNEPHVHGWRQDPLLPIGSIPDQCIIDFPQRDIYAMSSFDDQTTLASVRSLSTVHYGETLTLSRRHTTSDPLSLHQFDPNTIYAGLRSSQVTLEDLRSPPRHHSTSIAFMPGGKAVIGVKKLKDSAVPWGMLASAMGNQLYIYDTRFAAQPLRTLPGHVNTYHFNLALSTAPDDTVVFAGGGDHRLRAWSTLTGEPLKPVLPRHRRNALTIEYRHLVEHVDIAADLTLRVASGPDILRFAPHRPAVTR
ncbi:uncharacterized protein LOC62_07G009163 [Vanrija pseudolonga]|uniref:Uncharacterized protein n=1 Tax=Vanrija pseudolonga TaxID=143232 RepID=A0AAF0YFE9_9TREE|nr:hypothetical protein LOC62_07G009163 [Vanrija pseudolonga]